MSARVEGPASSLAVVGANRWRRRVVWVAGPIALGAAMIFYFTAQSGPIAPELPAYSVAASNDPAAPAGAAGSARLRIARSRGARFELVLQPATPPRGKVVAYAFTLAQPGAEPAPLDAKVEISSGGAVRLTGTARSLEGAAEVRIVVGAPTDIGKFDDAAARASSGKTDEHVRVLVVAVEREG